MKLALDFLPGIDSLLSRYETVGQQPDNLCGPYWISLLLQTYGQISLSAVDVAKAASTILPNRGNPLDWVPPGAISRTGEGYSSIPTIQNIEACGTSVDGLIYATKTLSQERFCLLPLQINSWTNSWESGIDKIMQLCHNHPNWEMLPLLNVHTSYFWHSQLSLSEVVLYLASGKEPSTASEWSVGHFALLVGQAQVRSQHPTHSLTHNLTHSLCAILDTYPQFGWNGLHLQPPSAIAQSLHRPQQSTDGGILLFIKTSDRPQIAKEITQKGFQIASWDNGTPFCSV